MILDIGIKIKELRKQRGWSQQELADMAGLNRTTVGAIERGLVDGDIGILKVEKVLSLFGKTLDIKQLGLPTLDELQNGE